MWVWDPEAFEKLRKKNGLTSYELSQLLKERIGKASKQMVDQWVAFNRTPHIAYLVELCDIFKVGIKAFLKSIKSNQVRNYANKRGPYRYSKKEPAKRKPKVLKKKV